MDTRDEKNKNKEKVFNQVLSAIEGLSKGEMDEINSIARQNMLLVDAIKRSLKGKSPDRE